MNTKRPDNPLSYVVACVARVGFGLMVIGTLALFDLHVMAGGYLVAIGMASSVAAAALTCMPGVGTFSLDAAAASAARRGDPFLVFILPAPALALVSRTIAPGHRPPRAFLAA